MASNVRYYAGPPGRVWSCVSWVKYLDVFGVEIRLSNTRGRCSLMLVLSVLRCAAHKYNLGLEEGCPGIFFLACSCLVFRNSAQWKTVSMKTWGM